MLLITSENLSGKEPTVGAMFVRPNSSFLFRSNFHRRVRLFREVTCVDIVSKYRKENLHLHKLPQGYALLQDAHIKRKYWCKHMRSAHSIYSVRYLHQLGERMISMETSALIMGFWRRPVSLHMSFHSLWEKWVRSSVHNPQAGKIKKIFQKFWVIRTISQWENLTNWKLDACYQAHRSRGGNIKDTQIEFCRIVVGVKCWKIKMNNQFKDSLAFHRIKTGIS